MAKVRPSPVDRLTMQLSAPGMSSLHRAGLGGLACTLAAIDRHYRQRRGPLAQARLPAPYVAGAPPWEIDEDSVTLKFGQPEQAAVYLENLFAFAFTIRPDGLIYLPANHLAEPSAALLADLQHGLTLTFLQHGYVRELSKELRIPTYQGPAVGVREVVVPYRPCTWFKHQDGWRRFVHRSGLLLDETLKLDGSVCPGACVRHVQFPRDTAAEEPPQRMLPLYFALVGCLALPLSRSSAVLLVPEVDNLRTFLEERPAMTPQSAADCRITNAADAAFQALCRVRRHRSRTTPAAQKVIAATDAEQPWGCRAMTFATVPWSSFQKARVSVIRVPPTDKLLDRFDRAWRYFPPRISTRSRAQPPAHEADQFPQQHLEAFRADGVLRPLIAKNLARGAPWYAGFLRHSRQINPNTGEPFNQQLYFERQGLRAMIADPTVWDHAAETALVRVVHEAIRQTLRRIRQETDCPTGRPSPAARQRYIRFREGFRRKLSEARTAAEVRLALSGLSAPGDHQPNSPIGWASLLFDISADWQLARDLSSLALVSYSPTRRGVLDPSARTNTFAVPKGPD